MPDEVDDSGHPVDPDAFDPAWLLYLPHEDAVVAALVLRVGAPAPAPGMAIIGFEPQISSVTLIDAETSAPAVGEPAPPAPSPTAPEISSETPGTSDGGAPLDSAPPPPPAISGDPLTDVGDGAHLSASGRDLGPVDADGGLPDETRSAVIELAGPDPTVSLRLVEPAPAGARMIAASALFNGPTGTLCVATRTRPQETPDVHPVLPVRTDLDGTLVVGAPDGAFEVQVNPPLETRKRCRS